MLTQWTINHRKFKKPLCHRCCEAENIYGWCAFHCDHPRKLRHNKTEYKHHSTVCQKWWWQSAIYFKTSSQMLHACIETTNECRATDTYTHRERKEREREMLEKQEPRDAARQTGILMHTSENNKITNANVLKTTVNETWDRVTVWCALHSSEPGKWQSKRRNHNDKNKHSSSLTNAVTQAANKYKQWDSRLGGVKAPKSILDSIIVLELSGILFGMQLKQRDLVRVGVGACACIQAKTRPNQWETFGAFINWIFDASKQFNRFASQTSRSINGIECACNLWKWKAAQCHCIDKTPRTCTARDTNTNRIGQSGRDSLNMILNYTHVSMQSPLFCII